VSVSPTGISGKYSNNKHIFVTGLSILLAKELKVYRFGIIVDAY